MAIKEKSIKLEPGRSYLFVMKEEQNPLTTIFATNGFTQGQLYALLHGKEIPVDGYASDKKAYSTDVFKCIGAGEVLGLEFENGELSVGLKNFRKKNPKNTNDIPHKKGKK